MHKYHVYILFAGIGYIAPKDILFKLSVIIFTQHSNYI